MPPEHVLRGAPDRAPRPVTCDVSDVAEPDLGTVDVIARLQLVALRGGFRLRLRGCSDALRELVLLAGLDEALPMTDGSASAGQPQREVEQREESRGVEEERDAADASG